MADLRALSLNTITVHKRWALVDCIEGCKRHGIQTMTVWRHDIEDFGVAAAAKRLKESGLRIGLLSSAGRFPESDATGRRRAFEDGRRAIDEAAAIGAEALLVVPGGLPNGSKDLDGARDEVRDGLAALLEEARAAGVALALEPFHPMYAADKGCICTLSQALDLCDELGDGLGVAVDVYHLWWEPRLETEIARAGGSRILSYQVSDWLVPTRDMALDRGMMGDGVIDIPRITRSVERAGYAGPIDVEIFSAENWWKRDPDEVIETITDRFVRYV